MADCLVDLILRPGHSDLPVVQAQLTVVASVETLAGGDQPGEVDGQVVPAELVRQLARRLGLIPDGLVPDELVPDELVSVDTDRHGVPATELRAATGTAAPEPATGTPQPAADDPAGDGTSLADDPDDPADPADDPAGDVDGDVDGCPPPGWSALGWAELAAQAQREATRAAEAGWDEAGWAESSWAEPGPESGTWLGAESPPEDIQQALWEREAEWAQWVAAAWVTDPPLPPDPEAPPPTGPGTGGAGGTWAAADAAVSDAGAAVEAARRAAAAAARAVWAAELTAEWEEAAWAASPAGWLTRAHDSLTALNHATAAQREAIGDLLTRTGGGGLVDRPRIAVVDALSGTLLALTDAPQLRRHAHCGRPACARRRAACTHDLTHRPGLRPPADTDGYRPAAELDRFVRARDRRCRQPGCRNRVPYGGELDHDRRWPDGPTAATNLTGYCTRHHRGKHQAPGWTYHLHPDGRLTITTPTGLTTTTQPPRYDTPATTALTTPRQEEPAPF